MSISGYSVENYKAFADAAHIELKPLTLLFGFNSSGKSALLRLLPLLRESILSSANGPLALGCDAARGASFSDLLSQFLNSPVITLRLQWTRADALLPSEAEFAIRDFSELRTQVVERLTLKYPNGEWMRVEWVPSASEGALSTQYTVTRSPHADLEHQRYEGNIFFQGLSPVLEFDDVPFLDIYTRFKVLGNALREFATGVHWLQALRSLPPRWENLKWLSGKLSPDGAEITQMLSDDESRGGKALEEVSRWYAANTNHRLELRRGAFLGKELFSLMLVPAVNEARGMDIVDTGEGMGQVLPVIGLLAFAKHGKLGPSPIISIEHPELHLHSSAHPGLAAMFCDVAGSNKNARLVVETHSENFLLKVQLAIAKREFDARNVVIYWVRPSDAGSSVVDKIEFDELARPLGDRWPPGLFAETLDQSKDLIRARRAAEER
jgi:hypothetical protein